MMTTYTPDFPRLTETVHRIPDGQIYAKCSRDMHWLQKYVLLMLPVACAYVDPDKGRCDIFVGETSTDATLEHEREHCRGGHHWLE